MHVENSSIGQTDQVGGQEGSVDQGNSAGLREASQGLGVCHAAVSEGRCDLGSRMGAERLQEWGMLAGPAALSLAGEKYIACLPDNSTGAVALAAFSAAHEGLLAPEACSAFCFAAGQGLAALSEQGWCLCGAAQDPNVSSACLPFCSDPLLPPAPACRGPTLLQNVFPASPGAALVGPQGPLASGQPASFHVTALLPVSSTRWDFGDDSPEVDVAGPATTHRYVLPGRYHVTAVLALGAGSARLGAEVQVEAAPAALELVCLASVRSDETLKLSVRNRGGSDLEATYSIMALGEEPAQGVCLPTAGPGSPSPSSLPGFGLGGPEPPVGTH